MRIEDQLKNLVRDGLVQAITEGRGAKSALQEELVRQFLSFMKVRRLLRGKRNEERLILAEKVASDMVNNKMFCREADGKWGTISKKK